MLIEYLSYIVAFLVSSGVAIIGIMISYQNFLRYKAPVLSILLYQQIFLFSFFVYGIWGNIALHEIISDLNISAEISDKLTFFIPIIGIPFLVVSWFMLLKFGLNSNGYKISRVFIFSYFPTFVIILFLLTFFIQKGILKIPEEPDLFIVRIIVALNLLIHTVFLIPFIFPKINATLKEIELDKKWGFIYAAGVLVYSLALSFFNLFSYISTNISIVLLFGISIIIPVKIYLNEIKSKNLDFDSFCTLYEISKREAEIVLEICTGKSNKAIADKLFITLQTVKDHNHRIFTKTDVKSRVQLTNLVREKTGN
jgi:DNA-binding CsgD family transcriptional regulator